MSSFWGVEVKPGKPHTLTYSDSYGRLRLTQATLGNEVGKVGKGAGGKKCVVQCSVDNKDPVFLCVLVSEQSETCHLELEFEEEQVTFSVIGPRSVHLAGYYIVDAYEEDMGDGDAGSDSLQGSDDDGLIETDDDDNMVMIDQMTTDSEDDDSDYDSETDDEEMSYKQHRGKSSVVIEEIQEDDKPAVGDTQKGSNKKSSENDDTSQLQLVVRTPPAESLESEDEDGFPVSFSESKKTSESVSKKNRNLNKEKGSEDRKRKSGAVSDNRDSSGEVKAENDGASKKKKRVKDKSTAVDTEKVNNEEKEIKQQDSPANPVSAKQRKKKNKNISASEAEQAAKKKDIHKDGEETAQEANKKKNKKKKTQDTNKSENQAPAGLMESENKKEPLQTRTFGNGMIIQEVEMGKPDGKKAAHGKKVSVRYIGKLTNGKIFDSNVGGRPFEFRLGVGEVIKGWDIGVNGMRIGDKRRLTIPPSMGYGGKRVGSIPQNSTLIFDVELVNVR
uniref:peptidylprolyl isomerase n=1 Tax=Arundo donax TaxID=35708 RepID=A0A0A9CZ30_ARUDO